MVAQAQPKTCFQRQCTRPPEAACGRCGKAFCADHGLVRGTVFRGLYDLCNGCRLYPGWRYLFFLFRALAIVAVTAVVGDRLWAQPGLMIGTLLGVIIAIVLLWRSVPE